MTTWSDPAAAAVTGGRGAASSPRDRLELAAWLLVLVPYLAGLLLWLGLGLVPTLAVHIAALRDALRHLAASSGGIGPIAYRILHRNVPVVAGGMAMGGQYTVAADGGTVIVQYLFSLLNLALGLLLVIKLSSQLEARLLALGMLGTAATFNAPSHEVFHVLGDVPAITGIHFTFHIVSGVAYLWAVLLFPDGRALRPPWVPRWAGRAAAAMLSAAVAVICWRSSFIHHPPFFVVFFGIGIPALGIPALNYRIALAAHDPVRRQQCRILRGALVPALLVGVVWLVAGLVRLNVSSLSAGAASLDVRLESIFPGVFALVPVALFVCMLRFRLFDVDVVVSRTLLYGSLAGLIALGYVLAVSLAGSASGGSAVTIVVVMTLVGLVIEPARTRLSAIANRLVFGQSLTPAEAMRRLAAGLDRMSPSGELLELARVVVEGTRAGAAELLLLVDEQLLTVARWPERPTPTAAAPAEPFPTDASVDGPVSTDRVLEVCQVTTGAELCLPVRFHERLLGVLAIDLPPGTSLPPAEQRLVADLVGHAGLLVHNAHLGAELGRRLEDLSERTAELRAIRREVVHSQDGERRRLERNLHDGAQQQLVAALIALGNLERATSAGGAGASGSRAGLAAAAELDVLLASTSHLLDVLAGGGLPETLVRAGVVPALEEAASLQGGQGPAVEVVASGLGRFDPEVESAVYFSCLEALQNATKHARARHVRIELRRVVGDLELAVSDDGVGFDPAHAAGGGLRHLVERLAVLGGSVSVESAPGRGATVRGVLPLAPS